MKTTGKRKPRPAKAPRELERHIQERIVDLLEAAGAEVVENRSQKWDALASAIGARNRKAKDRAKGQVDVIAALPGGFTLWIEVKRPGEDPDADQRAHHSRLVDLQHIIIVARDHSDVVTAVEAHALLIFELRDFARKLRPAA